MGESAQIRLMLVDDHLLFRQGIKSLLGGHEDVEVVAEAAGAEEALRTAEEVAPDIILMDLNMPGMDGLEACRLFKARLPCARIIILTVVRDLTSIVQAVKAGASGYLTKDTGADQVLETVRRVYQDGNLLEPMLADRLLAEFSNLSEKSNQAGLEPGLFSTLSPRETEILKLVAIGKPNKIIASELAISEHTVRNHISNIFQKLQVNNRTEATVLAMKKGLI
ncbi:MAG: response regulator transcription factor [Armatimonadetes bacterium]|nr:response regulator transcription factor [Armatimonadota bacterium]